MGYLNTVGYVLKILKDVPGIHSGGPQVQNLNFQRRIKKHSSPIAVQGTLLRVPPAVLYDGLTDGHGHRFLQQFTALFDTDPLLVREHADPLFCPGLSHVIEDIPLLWRQVLLQNAAVAAAGPQSGTLHWAVIGRPGFACPTVAALVPTDPAVVCGFNRLPQFVRFLPYLFMRFSQTAFISIGAIRRMTVALVDHIIWAAA